jgi:excisionase family DNA binding protein
MLTIPQAAQYAAIALWRVRTLIWNNELRAVKIGRRFVIDRADIDRYLDAQLKEKP